MSDVYSIEPLGPGGEGDDADAAADAPASTAKVPEALVCTHCGYALRGLAVTAACPECGTLVEVSLRGPMLRNASPEYLRSLLRGVWLVLASIAAMIVLFLLAAGGSVGFTLMGGSVPPWFEFASRLFDLVPTVMGLAGYWLFTTPDPALSQAEQPAAARRVVRAMTLVQLGGAVVGVVANLLSVPGALGGGLDIASGGARGVQFIAWVVQFFAVMLYVRWLAMRVPDHEMMGRVKTYMWLLPVLFVVLCVLGMLAAMIMYIILMDQVRGHIKVALTAAVLRS